MEARYGRYTSRPSASCQRLRRAAGDIRSSCCGSECGGTRGPSSEMMRPVMSTSEPSAPASRSFTAASAVSRSGAQPIATAMETRSSTRS
ncbi:hypothetical protein D514_0114500 [Microbacterium sp. UCD-TDU]|nr:hypothetical protein D514_0114500 [Microbacterium sp. UCD-TDU]